MKHFSSISSYLEYVQFPAPEHPMLSVLRIDEELMNNSRPNSAPITTDFYLISLKNVVNGELNYGRTKYDFSQGAMGFLSPGQTIQWDEDLQLEEGGFMITFHEDFIRGTSLAQRIKDYSFFSYAVHEALHCSPKEEQIVMNIFETIESEYHNNQDQFSKDILISQLETLLKFSDRFYNRQFIHRQEVSSILLDKFRMALRQHYAANEVLDLPNIQAIADQLLVSPRYLSDALKRETGKTSKEHINLFVVEKAKDKLLGSNDTISQIAYDLGFEYPQHFSKMFKKQTQMSPKEYRTMN